MGKLYCSATSCHNYSGKKVNGKVVKLHRFPVNKKMKSLWTNRVSRKNWKPTNCSRLCSEHFISRTGPTKKHPIPSRNLEISNARSWTTTIKKENASASTGHDEIESVEGSSKDEHDDNANLGENNSFFIDNGLSMLNSSVMFHDYCGIVDVSTIANKINQSTQCDNIMLTKGIQTEEPITEGVFYTARQIADADTNVNLPTLTIEDISTKEVNFYTGLSDKEAFYELFEQVLSKRKYVPPELGGRPKKIRDVDALFMVLMRLKLGLLIQDLARRFNISVSTCSKVFNEWLDLIHEHVYFLVKST